MNWNAIVGGALALALGLISIGREWSGSRGVRSRIKQDLELLGQLPKDSAVRDELRTHVDRSIARLIESEHELRRDPTGMVLAAFLALATTWMVAKAIDGSGLWWVGAGATGLFAVAGFAVSVQKVRRDERGRVIKQDKAS